MVEFTQQMYLLSGNNFIDHVYTYMILYFFLLKLCEFSIMFNFNFFVPRHSLVNWCLAVSCYARLYFLRRGGLELGKKIQMKSDLISQRNSLRSVEFFSLSN